MSIFDSIWSGVKDVATFVYKNPVVIPGVGPTIALGSAAIEAVTGGGGVTVTDPSGDVTRYGSDTRTTRGGFFSASFFGVPLWLMAAAGVIGLLVWRAK